MNYTILTLPEVDSRIEDFEEQYGISSQFFIDDPTVVNSPDDRFEWMAYIGHRSNLLGTAIAEFLDQKDKNLSFKFNETDRESWSENQAAKHMQEPTNYLKIYPGKGASSMKKYWVYLNQPSQPNLANTIQGGHMPVTPEFKAINASSASIEDRHLLFMTGSAGLCTARIVAAFAPGTWLYFKQE